MLGRSVTAEEKRRLLCLLRSRNLCIIFFFLVARWWLPIMPEWRPRGLSRSPSLNSRRSNLQTAAEFWQILPWCLLPLGDTFLFFLSSALVFTPWSTGPTSDRQFCSPSMSEKPNGFTGFTVNLSLFSGLMNVGLSSVSSLFISTLFDSPWWLGRPSYWRSAVVALAFY